MNVTPPPALPKWEDMNQEEKAEAASRVLVVMNRIETISKLSDLELSDRIVNEVWGRMYLGSVEETLLNELVTRFEKLTGIERNEEGEIVKTSGWKS